MNEADEQNKNNLKQRAEIESQKKEIESIKKLEQQRKDALNASQLLETKNRNEVKLIQKMKKNTV